MDGLIQMGIEWIVAIQRLGGWLETPMQFFSFLGSQDFFFLVLPLIYWSVDAALGVRVGMMLLASASLRTYVKLWFADPRPYWVSDRVLPLAAEPTFGIPSGHAQIAVGLWGIIAAGIRKPWAWAAAIALAILIGFSRLYLGVHFVHDVVAGWLFGVALLWLFIRFWEPIAEWLKVKTKIQIILIAGAVSLAMIMVGVFSVQRLAGFILPAEWVGNALRAGEAPDPVSMEDTISLAGAFFGLSLGLAWIGSKGGYQASGSAGKRALRFVVGVIGVLFLWRGLGMVLPDGETLIPLILRYIRYVLVGFWITGGAPWLFFRIKLADAPKP